MRKLLFVLSLTLSFGVKAQITISDTDMPNVNDTFRLSETVDIQGLDPALTGANYTWNFSSLVPDAQRLDTFYSVTSTPFAYQFYFNNNFSYPNHKASYALRGQDINIPQVVDITEVFNFIKNSSTAYDNVGFGSKINGVPSSTQRIPVDREYEFPMNYLSNHNSNSEFGVSVPGFGYYGQTMERIDTVDGWGMLTTPYGTFNCLRVKSILNKVDTTYVDQFSFGTTTPRPEEIEYKWLASGMGVPVLKILTNSGFVTQIEYQDSARVGVSVAELSNEIGFKVYPNPGKEIINVRIHNFKVDYNYQLIDVVGTVVINDNKNKDFFSIDTSKLPRGVYFLNIDLNGNRQVKKIILN